MLLNCEVRILLQSVGCFAFSLCPVSIQRHSCVLSQKGCPVRSRDGQQSPGEPFPGCLSRCSAAGPACVKHVQPQQQSLNCSLGALSQVHIQYTPVRQDGEPHGQTGALMTAESGSLQARRASRPRPTGWPGPWVWTLGCWGPSNQDSPDFT